MNGGYAAHRERINRPALALVLLLHLVMLAVLIWRDRLSLPSVQNESALVYLAASQPRREATAPPVTAAPPSIETIPVLKVPTLPKVLGHPKEVVRPRVQPGFIVVLPPDFSFSSRPSGDLKPPSGGLGPAAPEAGARTEPDKLKLFWQEQARLNAAERKPGVQDPGHRFDFWSGAKCLIPTAKTPVQGLCGGLHF